MKADIEIDRDFQFYPINREAMNRFLSICERRHYPAKSTISRPGDPGDELLYIIEGAEPGSPEGGDGRELIFRYLNPADFMGDLGLYMTPALRSSLVRTRNRCDIAAVSYKHLREALEGELAEYAVDILTAIGSKLAERLLQTRRKVLHLAFLDTQGRIAKTLIELCKQPDAVSHPEGTQLRITRQELSRIVGCSREMAGRVMKILEEEGMVRASGKTVVVLGTYKGAPA